MRVVWVCAVVLAACEPQPPTPLQTSAASAREAETVPTIKVPRRSASITIDGALDDWKGAADTGAFVNVGSGAALPEGAKLGGSASLCWDDEHLYAAFRVRDSDVRGGFPADAVDPHLWTRDTVELMVDPDGDGDNRDYYEIQINPQNLIFDSQFDGYNEPRGGPEGPFGHQDWRAALDSATRIDGTLDQPGDDDAGYVVEARIPWRSFSRAKRTPPQIGDVWRMNFYAMQDNGGVAWSPILGRGNFHRASRFGRVQLAK